jgi:hypothetical protein
MDLAANQPATPQALTRSLDLHPPGDEYDDPPPSFADELDDVPASAIDDHFYDDVLDDV